MACTNYSAICCVAKKVNDFLLWIIVIKRYGKLLHKIMTAILQFLPLVVINKKGSRAHDSHRGKVACDSKLT